MNNSKKYIIFIFFNFFFLPSFAASNAQPIFFQADSVFFDKNTGVGNYKGHLQWKQGDITITAETAESYNDKMGHVERIVGHGVPAVYQTVSKTPKDAFIAVGRTIIYYPKTEQVEFLGEVSIMQGKNIFKGEHVTYDSIKKIINALPSPKGRSQLIIQPQFLQHLAHDKTSSPAPR